VLLFSCARGACPFRRFGHNLAVAERLIACNLRRFCFAIRTFFPANPTNSTRRQVSTTQAASDEALIARIAQGDRLAMQALYGRHHVRVFRFGLRLVRNEQIAEDLISEVFLDLWRQAGKFAGDLHAESLKRCGHRRSDRARQRRSRQKHRQQSGRRFFRTWLHAVGRTR